MADMEKRFRHDVAEEHEVPAREDGIAPGKTTVTSHMYRAPQIVIWRVADGSETFDVRADEAVAAAAASSGAALPSDVRARFEASLGADLGDVRVHTGGASAAAAAAVGAKAYTIGRDIHFAAGQYAPSDPFGVHLLAHEVAHTVQQAGGAQRRQHKLEVSAPGDAFEIEADRAADAMIAGQRAEVSGAPTIAAREPNAAGPADPNAGATETGTGGKSPTVDVKIVPGKADAIEFDAADYKELYKKVAARAAVDAEAGRCECGKIDVDTKTLDDKVTSITYTVPINQALPTWKQLASQPAADQAKFKAWVASVAVHEQKHFDIYKNGYNQLKAKVGALKGPSEADCDEQFKLVDTQVKKDQKDFDDDKSKQPAPLAIPGGVEKVQSAEDAGAATPAAGAPAPAPAGAGEAS